MIAQFKKFFRKTNIPVIIYLILNIALITAVLYLILLQNFWLALPTALILYAISIAIALSPIGEWILRLKAGCKEIKDPKQNELLQPIFKEVYDKAKALDPNLPDDVKLYIYEDTDVNAFATGRKTVCVSDKLLERPKSEIKAALSHEFGHLAHKDTSMTLIVTVGNMFVNAFIFIVRLMIELVHIFYAVVAFLMGKTLGSLINIFRSLYHILLVAVVNGLEKIWTRFGLLLIRKSNRSCEYEADEFSFDLGYKKGLLNLFNYFSTLDGDSGKKSLLVTLYSSHPEPDDRIARIKELDTSDQVKRLEK